MSPPLIREFRLAGHSCDGIHPFIDDHGVWHGNGTALLEQDSAGTWRPRPRTDLEQILSEGYGIRVSMERRMSNLLVVAKAMNRGDQALAAIALVHAEFPPLPDEDAAFRMARFDKLLKYNFDPDEPRVPAGNPDGGQWTNEGDDSANGSGARTRTGSEVTNQDIPSSESSGIEEVAYQGQRHDQLVGDITNYLRGKGLNVESNVPLTTIDGSTTAVADIVFRREDTGALCIVEVKTGDDPTFTPSQMRVYALSLVDNHILSNSAKISTFGLTQGQPLPAFELYVAWQRADGKLDVRQIPLQSLLAP